MPEDEYDFTVSMNDPELGYMGFEGRDLAVQGVVVTGEDEEDPANLIPFGASVKTIRMETEFVPETNPDTITLNRDAQKINVKGFTFEVADDL